MFGSNQLFRDDNELIVIGVIGKSIGTNCNKMAGLNMIKFVPISNEESVDGEIRFYFESPPTQLKTLYLHFQTTFDVPVVEQLLLDKIRLEADSNEDELSEATFHSLIRTKFAQILLFAIQICHIIVLVEPNNVFDTTYLSIFKALKVIR